MLSTASGGRDDQERRFRQYSRRRPEARARLLHLVCAPADLHFDPALHEDRVRGFQSFNCDDVERTYGELREKRVEFVSPPRNRRGTSSCWGRSRG
jgi:hypothetical protein